MSNCSFKRYDSESMSSFSFCKKFGVDEDKAMCYDKCCNRFCFVCIGNMTHAL